MKADEQTTEEWGLDRRVGFAVGLLMLILTVALIASGWVKEPTT